MSVNSKLYCEHYVMTAMKCSLVITGCVLQHGYFAVECVGLSAGVKHYRAFSR